VNDCAKWGFSLSEVAAVFVGKTGENRLPRPYIVEQTKEIFGDRSDAVKG